MRRTNVALVVYLGIACCTAEAEDLPKAVAAKIKEVYPRAKIHEVESEVKDGKLRYEVELKIGKKERDVFLTPEGEVIQVADEISVKSVPAAVLKAAKKLYPDMPVREAERITRDGKTYYLVELRRWIKEIEVEFTPAGEEVK